MFGQNEIVGMKYFKNALTETLTVTSRFLTIQGEGPFRGHAAYFIRLAKCNLACSFCDTYFDSGEVQSFDQIFEDVDKVIKEFFDKRDMEVPGWARAHRDVEHIELPADNGPHIQTFAGRITNTPRKIVLVITGGEPTLQQNLTVFLERAQHEFFHTQIESNGTNPIPLPNSTTFVVSPKCNEKKLDNGEYIATKYLQPKQAMLDRADCLKFVMCAPEREQFTPYAEVPDWAHAWARETGKPVFVSPMNIYLQEPKKAKELRAAKQGTEITIAERSLVDETISFWEPGLLDMAANQRNHEFTADYAMRHGFILNLQIHLFASLP
jgi:organic radical activating enzyme